ncbi:hypothetical protein, partial [Xanthomonas sp. D-36-1]|uniref:hypothetical protein n=1 Tax=Xanthomonas sp. D-36-1 TaxID=2821271 RepID=UPI001ADCC183
GEIPKFQKPLFGTTPPSALSGLVVQTFLSQLRNLKIGRLASPAIAGSAVVILPAGRRVYTGY